MAGTPTSPFPTESSELVQKDLYVSNAATLMHLLRGNIGIGALALPWAIKHAGIVLGPILLLVIGVTNASCMVTLVKCSRHFCAKLEVPSLDYGEVAFYSFLFGPIERLQRHAMKAKLLANFFLVLTQFGICCMYLVFIAQNIRQVIAVYWHSVPEDRVFMALLWVPITLLTFIRDLSKMAWLTGAANVIVITAFCMIFRYLLTHLVPVETRPFVATLSDYPLFLGSAIFTFEGIALILPLENAMRTPEDFQKIFYFSISIILSLYFAIGFFGYLTFGEAVCGSVTLNLPAEMLFYEMVRIFYSVVIFSTYGLQFYVAFQIVWSPIEKKIRPQTIHCELLARTAFVTLTCVLAISIPYIGDFNSLIGATSVIVLQYILPSVMEIMTFHSEAGRTKHPELLLSGDDLGASLLPESSDDRDTKNKNNVQSSLATGLSVWIVIKNSLILSLGLLGMVTGIFLSIRKIVFDSENYSSSSVCSGGLGKPLVTTVQRGNRTMLFLSTGEP